MDPLCYAMSLYRRRYHDRCMEICNEQIEQNPKNQVCSIQFLSIIQHLLIIVIDRFSGV